MALRLLSIFALVCCMNLTESNIGQLCRQCFGDDKNSPTFCNTQGAESDRSRDPANQTIPENKVLDSIDPSEIFYRINEDLLELIISKVDLFQVGSLLCTHKNLSVIISKVRASAPLQKIPSTLWLFELLLKPILTEIKKNSFPDFQHLKSLHSRLEIVPFIEASCFKSEILNEHAVKSQVIVDFLILQEINEVIKDRLDRSFPGKGFQTSRFDNHCPVHIVYNPVYLQPLQNVIEDRGFPQDLANRVKNNFRQFCKNFESAIEGILQKNFPKPESLCAEQFMVIIRLIVFGYQIMHVKYLSSEEYAEDLEKFKKPFENERTALSEWLPSRIPNFLLQKSNMYILFRNFLKHKSLANDPLDYLDESRDDVLVKDFFIE